MQNKKKEAKKNNDPIMNKNEKGEASCCVGSRYFSFFIITSITLMVNKSFLPHNVYATLNHRVRKMGYSTLLI